METMTLKVDFLRESLSENWFRHLFLLPPGSPLAGCDIQFLPEEAGEIVFVFKSRLHGDFFYGMIGSHKQITGMNHSHLQ